MVPLWEAAKKTVDGGISELKDIIEKRKNMEGKEEETLKLEVVEKDLQVLSMVRKLGADFIHIFEKTLFRNLLCISRIPPKTEVNVMYIELRRGKSIVLILILVVP